MLSSYSETEETVESVQKVLNDLSHVRQILSLSIFQDKLSEFVHISVNTTDRCIAAGSKIDPVRSST